MTEFLEPSSYDHLCDECRVALAQITRMFREDLMGDTDDEEAPCNYMYDHKLFCHGSTCPGEELEPIYIIHVYNQAGKKQRIIDTYGRNHAMLEAEAQVTHKGYIVTVEEWGQADFRVAGPIIWTSLGYRSIAMRRELVSA